MKIIWLLTTVVFFFNVYCECLEKIPIYYLNNDGDQTLVEHAYTKQQIVTIKSTLLSMLNVPKRPKVIKNPMKKSVSRFLYNLYKKTSQDDGLHLVSKRSVDNFFPDMPLEYFEDSDMVMAFSVRKVRSLGRLKGKLFWIDTNHLSGTNEVLKGELWIFKSLGKNITFDTEELTIHAFKVNSNDTEKVQFVKSINISKHYSGWLTLDITTCMKQWIKSPTSNQGIYLTVSKKASLEELHLDEVGVLYNGTEELRPFAVAFVQNQGRVVLRAAKGLSPSTPTTFAEMINPYRRPRIYNSCKRHTLTINFKDLNWQDWVVAPEGYTAHYCQGDCNFPLMDSMNATNHAILQSLMSMTDPYRFPKPTCAPNSFYNMSLLYFRDEENVTLQKYTDLLVRSCGCH